MFSLNLYVQSHRRSKEDQLKSSPPTEREVQDAIVKDCAFLAIALLVTTIALMSSNSFYYQQAAGIPVMGLLVMGMCAILSNKFKLLELPANERPVNKAKPPLGTPLTWRQ